jgi:hypothetical protein
MRLGRRVAQAGRGWALRSKVRARRERGTKPSLVTAPPHGDGAARAFRDQAGALFQDPLSVTHTLARAAARATSARDVPLPKERGSNEEP